MRSDEFKHFIWAITIFSIVLMMCATIIYLNYNAWTIRFEMDNNTLEAIKSINCTTLGIASNSK